MANVNLFDIVRTHGKLSFADAVDAACEAAWMLCELHAAGRILGVVDARTLIPAGGRMYLLHDVWPPLNDLGATHVGRRI